MTLIVRQQSTGIAKAELDKETIGKSVEINNYMQIYIRCITGITPYCYYHPHNTSFRQRKNYSWYQYMLDFVFKGISPPRSLGLLLISSSIIYSNLLTYAWYLSPPIPPPPRLYTPPYIAAKRFLKKKFSRIEMGDRSPGVVRISVASLDIERLRVLQTSVWSSLYRSK